MIFLENEFLKATFSLKGAELQSLKSQSSDTDYMWSGDKDFWGKHSPVLFPIVGGLKENKYKIKQQEYTLSRHGFARDLAFSVNQLSPTELEFSLNSSEETLKVYPFEFVFEINYKLVGPTLYCTYKVSNPSNESMLFSVGGHPAFATPVKDELKYDDYYLKFNNDTELEYHKISNDMILDETVKIPLNNSTLPLTHELFYEDALVFKTLKSDRISLLNNKNNSGLHFAFKDFPFFGIWAAKDADFVCLEPWCGIADGINHNQDFTTKEGIIKLEGHQKWSRSWSAECF